jgi:hypothetical protein
MDVTRQFEVAYELMDWVLPTLPYDDHRVQEEETWSSV